LEAEINRIEVISSGNFPTIPSFMNITTYFEEKKDFYLGGFFEIYKPYWQKPYYFDLRTISLPGWFSVYSDFINTFSESY